VHRLHHLHHLHYLHRLHRLHRLRHLHHPGPDLPRRVAAIMQKWSLNRRNRNHFCMIEPVAQTL